MVVLQGLLVDGGLGFVQSVVIIPRELESLTYVLSALHMKKQVSHSCP